MNNIILEMVNHQPMKNILLQASPLVLDNKGLDQVSLVMTNTGQIQDNLLTVVNQATD